MNMCTRGVRNSLGAVGSAIIEEERWVLFFSVFSTRLVDISCLRFEQSKVCFFVVTVFLESLRFFFIGIDFDLTCWERLLDLHFEIFENRYAFNLDVLIALHNFRSVLPRICL